MLTETGIYMSTSDTPHWYALHTNPKQEDRAYYNLQDMRVEAFAPRIKQPSQSRRANTRGFLVKSLFPGYIFARFELMPWLHKVRFTRGVHSVVNCDGKPLPVEDEIIAAIQTRVAEDGFVKFNDEFKAGEKVIITSGVFKGLAGMFERKLNDSERVVILLSTIGYQANLTLDVDQIRSETRTMKVA
jgi:transcriptional antiterminator RfaH